MLVPISQLTKYVAALLIGWVVLSINAFASPRLVIDESFERKSSTIMHGYQLH